MVLTEMVCHLQKVATESAAEAAKQRAEVGAARKKGGFMTRRGPE